MNKLKTVIRIIAFWIIGIFLFFLVSSIFVPKTVNEKKGFYRSFIQGFYAEPRESLDVIFIGESSVNTAISPIEIWEKYGFTSYDFASPGQKIWDSYYCIEEVLKYQKPKVIVVNVDQVFSEEPMKEAYKRHLYDNMNYSINKVKAIIDPVQKNEAETWSLLFPIFRFHSRWSELDEDDFTFATKKIHYSFKGYRLIKKEQAYNGKQDYMDQKSKKNRIGKNATKYLEKIKEVCQKNNVELLLIETPSPRTWNKNKSEEMARWANQNKVSFLDLNFFVEEMNISWKTDTKDEGYHMNIYGAEKISKYMGEYLKQHYPLRSHKKDGNYRQWYEDAKHYQNQKENNRK